MCSSNPAIQVLQLHRSSHPLRYFSSLHEPSFQNHYFIPSFLDSFTPQPITLPFTFLIEFLLFVFLMEDNNIDTHILFAKYETGRFLGKGTFAKVYYARQIATNESVAIKVLDKDKVQRQGLMEQIKREISVMKLVKHPNVVELKEVMATKSKIFFVMEYVKGGELFSKLARSGKLREDLARKYFQQLISAVDFCHSRGVSHRDLKPENLLIDEHEDLKISDFGLSALPEQLRYDGLLHTQCGTPAYVAPEVLRRKGYDGAKADTWSCGVILYVLLAGFLPFQDENLMNMYQKVFKAQYDFPAWFSPESRRLISKLLVADPDRRITIPAITRVPWFHKGFSRNKSFAALDDEMSDPDDEDLKIESMKRSSSSPAFFNAFEFISSMSSGFDLSNLFDDKKKVASVFTSRCSASAIVEKIETVAKGLRFKVGRVKDFKVKMKGQTEGRKGRLLVTAEVFEVAPEVSVVEFSKCSGDTLEYARFCQDDVRPALKDIVWTWQGDHDTASNGNSNGNGNGERTLGFEGCQNNADANVLSKSY